MPKYIDISTKYVATTGSGGSGGSSVPSITYTQPTDTTNIAGNAKITGLVSLSNVLVTNNIDASGSLAIGGELTTKNVKTRGNCSITGGCDISGSLAIGGELTTKKIVSTGITTRGNCVLGATDISGGLLVVGDSGVKGFFLVEGDIYGQNLTTSGLITTSALNATGQSMFSAVSAGVVTATKITVGTGGINTSTLNVTGDSTLSTINAGTVNVTGLKATYTLIANGPTTLTSSLAVTGATTLASSLAVSGATALNALTLYGALDQYSISKFRNFVEVDNHLSVANIVSGGSVLSKGILDVSGNSEMKGTLKVGGNIIGSSTLSVPTITATNINVGNCDMSNCHISKVYDRVFSYPLDTINFIYDFTTSTSSTCVLPVINLSSNFNIIITNIPTDTSKVYTVSFMFRQPSTCFYIGGVRASDTAGNYLCGTASTYGVPLYNGGTPSFSSTSVNVMIQSFSIPSFLVNESSVMVYKRPVLSSVNSHF